MTYVLAMVLKATIGLRVTEEEEVTGIDQTVHAESAYEFGASLGGGGGVGGALSSPLASSTRVSS